MLLESHFLKWVLDEWSFPQCSFRKWDKPFCGRKPFYILSALCSNDYNNGNGQNGKYGISLEDYLKIFAVLTHIDDVDKVKIFFIQWKIRIDMEFSIILVSW